MPFGFRNMILLFGGLFLFLSCKEDVQKNLFDLACEAEERRDFAEAVSLLNKLLEENPKDLYALNNRGWDKYDLGDHSGALRDFNTMIKVDSLCDKGYNSRGVLYAQQRKYQKALKDFSQVIKLKGGGPAFKEPEEKENSERPEKPIASLGDLFYWKGISNYYEEEYTEAFADFTFCIDNGYYLSDALYMRAFVYYKAGEKEKGCEDLSQALLRGSDSAKRDYQKYCDQP